MKLVIMTKSTFFVEEDKILTSLFDEGLDNLHLYKPGASPVYSERLLSLLPDDFHRKITVHEHFYLKNEYKLAGIHVNYPDPIPVGYKGHVSRSCNDLSMLKGAKKKSEYVFLANTFDDLGQDGGQPASFTMEQLRDAARHGLIDRHVYAQGGVTLEHVGRAKDLGFGGIVVCGDLWNRFDIHNQQDFLEIINYFKKLRKAVG